MNLVARILFAALMLMLAGFCVFGFVITYDNNPAFTMNPKSAQWTWRAIYAVAGLFAGVTAIRLLWPGRGR